MKPLLVYISSLLIVSSSFGQRDSVRYITEDAIRSRVKEGRIIYLDSAISFYTPFSAFASNRKVAGFIGDSSVSMAFTKKELALLDEKFKNSQPAGWGENMFPNSMRITVDTLSILGQNDKGHQYFEQHFANKYFEFSQPVFIRNNSIAVFRLAEMFRPSAGNDLLYIYAKKDSSWKQVMLIYAGAW